MIEIIFAAVSLESCRNATGKSCNTGKARGTISAMAAMHRDVGVSYELSN